MMKFDAAPTMPGRAKIVDQNGPLPSAKSTHSGCACGSPQGRGNGEDGPPPRATPAANANSATPRRTTRLTLEVVAGASEGVWTPDAARPGGCPGPRGSSRTWVGCG